MKFRVLVVMMLLFAGFAFAEGEQVNSVPSVPSLTTPQNISFEHCTKMFEGVNKEKLFYLTLSAVNANKFSIEEIQTNNGYIMFSAAKNKYLATVAGIDDKNSILKITPCNDIYYFQPGIVVNMFKYIEMNKNTEIK